MRLRRETGDFEIVVNSDNGYKATINRLLYAADLLGQVVNNDGQLGIVTSAKDIGDDKATAEATVGSVTYVYTRATGAFEKKA